MHGSGLARARRLELASKRRVSLEEHCKKKVRVMVRVRVSLEKKVRVRKRIRVGSG